MFYVLKSLLTDLSLTHMWAVCATTGAFKYELHFQRGPLAKGCFVVTALESTLNPGV